MGIDTAYSLVPAFRNFPRPVSRIAEPAFPKQNHQPRTRSREVAAFTYSPGEPRGIYSNLSRMTYPAANTAGRIVNIYV